MTAWQRSNITERAEKGIGPISFKRLLLASGAAGIIALVGGRAAGFVTSCLSAAVVLALVLIITHPVEGMPLFAFSLRTLRGLATVAALHDQAGMLATVGSVMQVSSQEGMLHADDVYETTWQDEQDADLLDGEWEYLGGFADVKSEGLAAANNPFAGKQEAA